MAPVHSVWLSIITQTRHQLNMVGTDSNAVSLLCMCVYKSSGLSVTAVYKVAGRSPWLCDGFPQQQSLFTTSTFSSSNRLPYVTVPPWETSEAHLNLFISHQSHSQY